MWFQEPELGYPYSQTEAPERIAAEHRGLAPNLGFYTPRISLFAKAAVVYVVAVLD